jgi:hypothetical protein
VYQLLPILLLLSKLWIKWVGINPPGQVGSGEGSNQGSSTLDEEENNLGK